MSVIVHFYYPSAQTACRVNLDDLPWGRPGADVSSTLTTNRDETTCPDCLQHLMLDRAICGHCRGEERAPHTCDPGRPE